jgi:glycosyltransferase involved in cell wall biosynthesis
MRVLAISDSPTAPTGFGTNTKNVASILAAEGETIGYGGCQNKEHVLEWSTEWPLGSEEKVNFEMLPIMYPGQEKFGEKSLEHWLPTFKPQLILTHLDVQMMAHISQKKTVSGINFPLHNESGKPLNKKERYELLDKTMKDIQKGPGWKLASIFPVDGQPSVQNWYHIIKNIDYPIAMSMYGYNVLKADFPQLGDEWFNNLTYIPHGVDCDFFKPKLNVKPDDAFVVGCVARNQHRKNIPRLIKGFKSFVKKNDLTPKDAKLLLHMDWKDYMGWDIEYMATYYGIREYMVPPTCGAIDNGDAPDEAGMVDIYNLMDVFVLPTAGEGFGIPTVEAMACGLPVCVTNYTTGYELVKMEDPENEEMPLMPLGEDAFNGRDYLEPNDWSDRGCLLPYKDMWWDTPVRAAPMRAIVSEVAIEMALTRYYNDRELLAEHSLNARKHAKKNYDWSVVGERWKKWLKNIKEEK